MSKTRLTKSMAAPTLCDDRCKTQPFADQLRATISYAVLEQRIVFDGAAVGTAADAVAADNPHPAPEADSGAGDRGEASVSQAETLVAAIDAAEPVSEPSSTSGTIVFIDARVSDADLIAASAPADAEIVVIDLDRDGVEQIAEYLDGRTGVETLHIVSHGGDGELILGDTTLDAASMRSEHAGELTAIAESLSDDADILIYGCNFTSGDNGREAAALLGVLTGADIAASNNNTGNANLGGDWTLETELGEISAEALAAPEFEGLLAPLTISTTNPPDIVYPTPVPVNGSVIWTNAGDIGGTSIDLKATVISADASVSVHFDTYNDNPSVVLLTGAASGGDAVIQWEIFESGTNQTVIAVGSPEFTIQDIDGSGAPFTIETVAPNQDGLLSYTVDQPTAINITTPDGQIVASGTDDDFVTGTGSLRGTAAVQFTWEDVSSWQIAYTAERANDGRVFQHDGDGDFTFVNPLTVSLPKLDLDTDDSSTATGADYLTTFTEDAGAVAIGDTADLAITNVTGNLQSATATLTNAQSGDQLLVAGSSASSGTVNGLNYTVTNAGGQITVELTGAASASVYEAALKQISFNNTSDTPDVTNRTVDVSISNGTLSGNLATARIQVVPANDDPTAQDDTISGSEDTEVLESLFADHGNDIDTDVDGDAIFVVDADANPANGISPVSGPSNGTLVLNANGTFTYTPNQDFNGTDSFVYRISDGNGGFDEATVTLQIAGENDDPIVVSPLGDETATDGTPTSIPTVGTFDDVDAADTLSYSLAPGAPAWLTIDGTSGLITGTPPAGASVGGVLNDGVYDITVIATDNDGAAAASSFKLTVSNLAPVAVNDAAAVGEDDAAVSGNVITDAVTGDADTAPDTDPLSVTLATHNGLPIALNTPVTLAGGGTLTLETDGDYSFDPGTAYNGLDDGETATETVIYTVDDGNGGTDTATLTLTINGANDAPVIVDPSNPGPDPANPVAADPATIIPVQTVNDGADFSGTPLIDVSDYAVDPDGDPMTFATADTLPVGLTLNPDGTITGNVDKDASQGGPGNDGLYPITVVIDDGTTTATVQLTIDVSNLAPVAVNDIQHQTRENQSITLTVLPNDVDPDGDDLQVVSAIATNGTVFINRDGTLDYQPDPGFVGVDTVTYQISDGNGGFDTATVTVRVEAAGYVALPPESPSQAAPDTSEFAPRPTVRGAVLDAVAGLPATLNNSIISREIDLISQLAFSDGFDGTLSASELDLEGLTGFSLRLPLTEMVVASGAVSELQIETMLRDRVMLLEVKHLGPDTSANEFRFQRADGRALPIWLEADPRGWITGKLPSNVEAFELKVIAILSDGTTFERAVHIDGITGEVTKIALDADVAAPPMFSDQFDVPDILDPADIENLGEQLQTPARQ